MSSTDSLTQLWLRQHVQPYNNPFRVYTDIDYVLSRYSNLRPKSDVFSPSFSFLRTSSLTISAFDDGRTQLLLCVYGLLPISYRATPYNIPIAFWITTDYPIHPPLCFVVPTNNILIRPGKYIDVSGRCNTEYIQNWEHKDEVGTIPTLISFPSYINSSRAALYPHLLSHCKITFLENLLYIQNQNKISLLSTPEIPRSGRPFRPSLPR